MIKEKIYNEKGENVGEAELSEKVFGQPKNESLVHQAVVAQRANERQVLAHTKDRSEVRGGGKKPWRQKGTGRARVGSSRSPIWIGGGVTFGPSKGRNFTKGLNVKMKRQALRVALSDKVASKQMAILDELAMTEYKTKVFNALVDNLKNKVFTADKTSMLIIENMPEGMVKNSARNLQGVKLLGVDNINLVDVLKYRHVVITKKAIALIEERYKS